MKRCEGNFNTFLDKLDLLLQFATTKFKNVILAGDFNTNFNNVSSNTDNLLNLIALFGIVVTISNITRQTEKSASCIDNILTNIDDSDVRVGVLDPLLSDHYGQFITFKSISEQGNSDFKFVRSYSNRNIENFKSSLLSINWNLLYNSNLDASSLMDTFFEIFISLFQKILKQSNFQINLLILLTNGFLHLF